MAPRPNRHVPFKPFIGTLGLLLVTTWPVACAARQTEYISGTDASGTSQQLAVDRYPALYTGDFGDCLPGGSLFNVTRFDAALYSDNTTLLFHLDGSSNIKEEDLMMHISVDAYGQSRFSKTFDPCMTNVSSLCPLHASVPIRAWTVFQVTPDEINAIPRIEFSIPDYEGSARLQIFANSTQREIGCFQAVMTNGNSLNHPKAVGSVLGTFTVITMVSSFLVAAYGVSVPHMRMHYAHSLPVLVVVEVFQTIFFSGALSVNWPNILIGWWSNFAWSAGMIFAPAMVHSIDSFTGNSGNASQVGEAGSVVIFNQGGSLSASQIYGRSLSEEVMGATALARRQPYNEDNPFDYTWGGDPVAPGMPLPGTHYGFPGTLAGVQIPAANAFTLGLIWFLVVLGAVVLFHIALKFLMDGLTRLKWIKSDRLAYFRANYLGYTAHAVLRTLLIGFFTMTTLGMFQFTLHEPPGAMALAAIVILALLIGLGGIVAYACHYRLRSGKFSVVSDRIVLQKTRLLGFMPCLLPMRSSTARERGLNAQPVLSVPFFRIQQQHLEEDTPTMVHQDENYIRRFGSLASRYRHSRWWFSAFYLAYQFVRAAFLGGGARSPLAQVYGLFILEVIASAAIFKLSPFEGARNTAVGVWMISIVKIVTTGLSIAFLPEFNLNRSAATAIGIVIITIQGLLVVGAVILVVLSVISTWMSLSRNRADFSPKFLDYIRPYYFESMEGKSDGLVQQTRMSERKMGKMPEVQTSSSSSDSGAPKASRQSTFSVNSVRRNPKIEEEVREVEDVVADIDGPATHHNNGSVVGLTRPRRTGSINSRYSVGSIRPASGVPRRTSWSSRDLALWDASMNSMEQQQQKRRRLSGGGAMLTNNGSSARQPPPITIPQPSEESNRPVSPNHMTPRTSSSSSPRPVSPMTPSRPSTPTDDTVAKQSGATKPQPITAP